MSFSSTLRYGALSFLGLIATARMAHAEASLQFSDVVGNLATGFSNNAGAAGVNGMRVGIIVDTGNNGFAGNYDGGFDINVSGFLKVNGTTTTDDYYVALPNTNLTTTTASSVTDTGGSGSITTLTGVPYSANVVAGSSFMLIWFESGSAVGDYYGTLGNNSGTGTFVLPADTVDDGNGNMVPVANPFGNYSAFFAGTETIRAASTVFTAPTVDEKIVVKSETGANLVDAVSSVDFGSIEKATTGTQTFTIYNYGRSDLEGINATITGSSDFSVSLNPAPTLAGPSGATTSVQVSFTGSTWGAKTATLHIASSDPETPSFDITLNGTIIKRPGVLGFATANGTIVNRNEPVSGTAVVTVPITRTGGTDDVASIKVNSVNGSGASGAVAPGDFIALVDQVVSFANGESTKNVDITLKGDGVAENNETFTLNLSAEEGATRDSAKSSLVVRIVDSSDTTNPAAPTISAPLANAQLASLAPITVSGTATDNKGVNRVTVQLNTGSIVDATLGTPDAPSTTWSLQVTPQSGLNTLTVKSYDTRGNSSGNTVRTFKVLRPLVVNTVGAPAFGSITAGYQVTGSSSDRDIGTSYTIVATPKAPTTSVIGGIFTGWTLGGVDVANGNTPLTNANAARIGTTEGGLQKNSLTFIFREGMTLTATFIENPYNSTVTGSYNGLIKPSATLPDRPTGTDGTVTSNSSEGHFNATVQNTGGFSGKLTIDGFVLNIAGNFDHLGRARFGTAKLDTLIVPRTNKPSLYLKLYIGLTGVTLPSPLVTPAVGKILGEVSATEFKKSEMAAVSTFSADRAYYTGLTGPLTVPDEYLTVTGTAPSPTGRTDGTFTVVLESVPLASQPARIQSVFSAGDYPQGAGYGTLKVTKAGLVTLSGTLADGTPLAASGPLSQDNRVALFAQLYNKLGFYSVEVKLDSTQANTDMAVAATTEALWARPFIGTSHYYPYGWPEVLKSDFKGAKFVVTSGESVLRAPDDGDGDTVSEVLLDPTPDGNASLTFSDGQLSEDLVKVANISTTDGVVKVPDNDPTFTLSLTRTTGVVSGTLVHTDDTTVNFKGTVYQKGAAAGGYGFFQTKQPTVIDYTGESGGFTLIGQPKP